MNLVMWMCFAFLSALGSFSLMVLVWIQRVRRTPSSVRETASPVELIFYLSLCDFFLSLNNGVGYALRIMNNGHPVEGFWCSATFFVEHMAVITQILWYSMISFNILLILHGWKESQLRKVHLYQHIGIWGYALFSTIPPLVNKTYGPLEASAYCYFPNSKDPRRLLLYIPVTIGVLFSLGVFIYAVYFFRMRRGMVKGSYILFRLGFLCVIFTFFWGSAAGGRLYDALGNVDKSNLQLIANTLSGFANFVVWTATNRRVLTWVGGQISGGTILPADHQTMDDTLETHWTTAAETEEESHYSEAELERSDVIPKLYSINIPPFQSVHRDSLDRIDETP